MEKESETGKGSEESSKSHDEEDNMSSSKRQNVMKKTADEGEVNMVAPSWFPQKNPLLIDLILDATLSNLPLKDLLSCRLVCQEWNRISLPKVKPKCRELRFSSPNNHFLETMKNSLSIPCGKFEFKLDISSPDLSRFQELIDICANEITSLHLYPLETYDFEGTPTPGPASNKATFQNWLKALKNLTKLTITDFDFGVLSSTSFFEQRNDLNLANLRHFRLLEVDKDAKLGSQFFDGFFVAAQYLEKMSFGVRDYREEYNKFFPRPEDFDDSSDEERQLEQYEMYHGGMLDAMIDNEKEAMLGVNVVLNSVLNHGKLDGIKSLTFEKLNNVILATLVKLGENGLKLESFQVYGRIFFGDFSFCEFLETQKTSLKTLEISGGDSGECPPETLRLRFPSEMKELLRLTVYSNGPLEINEPICYTSRFPKIRKLHVEGGHRRSDYRQDVKILDIFFPEVENLVGCETLKELKMIFILWNEEPIDEDEIIQRVSRLFPGMVIHVHVDRAEYDEDEDNDDDEILENDRAKKMTLKIFGTNK